MDLSNINTDIITAGVFLFAFILTGAILGIYFMLRKPHEEKQQKLQRLKDRFNSNATTQEKMAQSLLLQANKSAIDQFLSNLLPRPEKLRERLAQTGKGWTTQQFAKFTVATFLIAFIAFALVIQMTFIMALLLSVLVALGLPHIFIGRIIAKRAKKFIELFPDAIDLIVRGLRSGLPVTESIANVAREIGDPVGIEFRKISDDMRLGTPLDEALWKAAGRINISDFNFFVISLAVQKETGGNLAETLNNLGDILRKRQQMKLKIKAMASEGKASAYIVGGLPFIMFSFLLTINYDYASTLFTDPRAIVAAIIGMVWMGIGVFVMSKMINFEI